jgi:hypothetical protein
LQALRGQILHDEACIAHGPIGYSGVVDRALMAVIEGVDRASLIDVVNVGKGVSGPIFLTAVSYMSM